jgi:hypothetical protein
MSLLSRVSLLAVAILGTAFILVQLELGQALWQNCFDGMLARSLPSIHSPKLEFPTIDPPNRGIDIWGIAFGALTRPSTGALLLVALMLPTLAAIAMGRRPGLAWVALAPMLLAVWLVHDPGGLHDCDRKGCNGCFGVLVLMLLLQLPIGTIVLIGLGLDRLWPRAQAKSTQ